MDHLHRWADVPGRYVGRRLLGGEGNPLDIPDSNFPFAVSLLFLLFMGIMIMWEVLIGTLAWFMSSWMHLKRVLVDRLKEELLALGVVSLVTAFASTKLSAICISTETAYEDYNENSGDCPEGEDNLFPPEIITTSHYLLFWIAVTQIGYTLLGAIFTALRFHRILDWEHAARSHTTQQQAAKGSKKKGLLAEFTVAQLNAANPPSKDLRPVVPTRFTQPLQYLRALWRADPQPPPPHAGAGHLPPPHLPGQAILVQPPPPPQALELSGRPPGQPGYGGQGSQPDPQDSGLSMGGEDTLLGAAQDQGVRSLSRVRFRFIYLWMILMGSLDQSVYSSLRKLLLLRVQCDPHSQELRTVNLAVAGEQLMHQDVSHVHAHTWLQVLIIAALMLYPGYAGQVVWINIAGLFTLVYISYKLQSITRRAVHLINHHLPDTMMHVPHLASSHFIANNNTINNNSMPVHADSSHAGMDVAPDGATVPSLAADQVAVSLVSPGLIVTGSGGESSNAGSGHHAGVGGRDPQENDEEEEEDKGSLYPAVGSKVVSKGRGVTWGAGSTSLSRGGRPDTVLGDGGGRLGPTGGSDVHVVHVGQLMRSLSIAPRGGSQGFDLHPLDHLHHYQHHTLDDALGSPMSVAAAAALRGFGSGGVGGRSIGRVGWGPSVTGWGSQQGLPRVGGVQGLQGGVQGSSQSVQGSGGGGNLFRASREFRPLAARSMPNVRRDDSEVHHGGPGSAVGRVLSSQRSLSTRSRQRAAAESRGLATSSVGLTHRYAPTLPTIFAMPDNPAPVAANTPTPPPPAAPAPPPPPPAPPALPAAHTGARQQQQGDGARQAQSGPGATRGDGSTQVADGTSGAVGHAGGVNVPALPVSATTGHLGIHQGSLQRPQAGQSSSAFHDDSATNGMPGSTGRTAATTTTTRDVIVNGGGVPALPVPTLEELPTLDMQGLSDVATMVAAATRAPQAGNVVGGGTVAGGTVGEGRVGSGVGGGMDDSGGVGIGGFTAVGSGADDAAPAFKSLVDNSIVGWWDSKKPLQKPQLEERTDVASSGRTALAAAANGGAVDSGGRPIQDVKLLQGVRPQVSPSDPRTWLDPTTGLVSAQGYERGISGLGPSSHQTSFTDTAAGNMLWDRATTGALTPAPTHPGLIPPGLERVPTLHHHPDLVADVIALEHKIRGLFWFGNPRLLLWVLELQCVCNASVLTLCFYYLASIHSTSAADPSFGNLGIWLLLAVYNIVMAMYIGWVVWPQYAILTTAVVTSTAKMQHHLKWANVVDEEEDKGVAGLTSGALSKVYRACKQRKRSAARTRRDSRRKERASHRIAPTAIDPTDATAPVNQKVSGAESWSGVTGLSLPVTNPGPITAAKAWVAGGLQTLGGKGVEGSGADGNQSVHAGKMRDKAHHAARAKLMSAWVASLAVRAGLILPAEHVATAQAHLSRHAPLFLGVVATWWRKAMVAQGEADPPANGYAVAGGVWLTAFRDAFDELDDDGTGTLHADELQEHLREAFNVRATQNEVKAMLWEVASGSSKKHQLPVTATTTAGSGRLTPTHPSPDTTSAGTRPQPQALPLLPKATPSAEIEVVMMEEGLRTSTPGGAGGLVGGAGGQGGDVGQPSRAVGVEAGGQGAGQGLVDRHPSPGRPHPNPHLDLRRTSLTAIGTVERVNPYQGLNKGAHAEGRAGGGNTERRAGSGTKTHSGVSFHTFVCFAAFAFLDPLKKGVLESRTVHDVLAANDWLLTDWELSAMIRLAMMDDATKVGSVQFLRLFTDVEFIED